MKVQIAIPKLSFICLILLCSTGCVFDHLPVKQCSKSLQYCEQPQPLENETGPIDDAEKNPLSNPINSTEVSEPEEATTDPAQEMDSTEVSEPEEATIDPAQEMDQHSDESNRDNSDSSDANDVASRHTKPVDGHTQQPQPNSSDTAETKAKQRKGLDNHQKEPGQRESSNRDKHPKPVAERNVGRDTDKHPNQKVGHPEKKNTASSSKLQANKDSENRSIHTSKGSSGAPSNTISFGRSNSDINPHVLTQNQEKKETNANSSHRVASESNLTTGHAKKDQKKDGGKKSFTTKLIKNVSYVIYTRDEAYAPEGL